MESLNDYIETIRDSLAGSGNTSRRGIRPNSYGVSDLTLSISNVEALPSKKASVDRPGARSQQRQADAEGSEQDINPRISYVQQNLPKLNDRHQRSGNGCP
jgi:hypothetical protein